MMRSRVVIRRPGRWVLEGMPREWWGAERTGSKSKLGSRHIRRHLDNTDDVASVYPETLVWEENASRLEGRVVR